MVSDLSHFKRSTKRLPGFTLIELLVVMAIIATLLTIALPRYFKSVDYSKEQVLRTNLNTMRDAIDKYYADQGHYPADLAALANGEYIKAIPVDPMTESSESWLVILPKDPKESGVGDIHSGASGVGSNHIPLNEW